MAKSLLGIFREVLHSPNREFDDHEILRSTAQRLQEEGLEAALKSPEEVLKDQGERAETLPDVAFIMCERQENLALLKKWESRGVAVVNSIESILNTYRYRMVPLLTANKVPLPVSKLVLTNQPISAVLDGVSFPVWIKRGDVHNTQEGDVSLANSPRDIETAFAGFRLRGIDQAVLQDHVPGDLIKFYGVGGSENESGTAWFRWFYHKNQDLKRIPFSEGSLQKIAQTAARGLGLEVFGGDAIAAPGGRLFLIDINAWPSFALFRDEASRAIARYLASKLKDKILA